MKKFNDVLVLNRAWCPIHIIDYKDAMRHIYLENVHSLDMEYIAYSYQDWLALSSTNTHFRKIHTVSMAIAIPEIIVLMKYNSLPDRDVKYSRENVFTRDKMTCQYCGYTFKRSYLTIDHVVPKHLGGKSVWNNVVCACKECNSNKGGKTLKESKMKLLHKPAQPKWINPLSKANPEHMCKSWNKFMKKMDTFELVS